jgi:hypothetical protein
MSEVAITVGTTKLASLRGDSLVDPATRSVTITSKIVLTITIGKAAPTSSHVSSRVLAAPHLLARPLNAIAETTAAVSWPTRQVAPEATGTVEITTAAATMVITTITHLAMVEISRAS